MFRSGQQLIIYLDDIVALWDNIHSFLLLPSFDWGKHRIICEAGKTSSKKKASGNGSEIEQKMLRALPTPRFMSTPPIGQLVRRPPAFKDLPTPPCPICFAQNWISAAPSRSVKCRFWDADCQVYVFSSLVTAFSADPPWHLQPAAQRVFLCRPAVEKTTFLLRPHQLLTCGRWTLGFYIKETVPKSVEKLWQLGSMQNCKF